MSHIQNMTIFATPFFECFDSKFLTNFKQHANRIWSEQWHFISNFAPSGGQVISDMSTVPIVGGKDRQKYFVQVMCFSSNILKNCKVGT